MANETLFETVKGSQLNVGDIVQGAKRTYIVCKGTGEGAQYLAIEGNHNAFDRFIYTNITYKRLA